VAIFEQLGLDRTFFVQLAIFTVVFLLLSRIYFKPFLKLFEIRRRRTVEDGEAADKLLAQAEAKLDEYKRRIAEERQRARQDYEAAIERAKKEQAELLAAAREEAKRIAHEAQESLASQREQLKEALAGDVEALARKVSDRILSGDR
jgi:F-type H+-transporting ATPase subunit b